MKFTLSMRYQCTMPMVIFLCTVELTSVLVSLFQSSEQRNYNNLLNVKTFYSRLSRKSLTDDVLSEVKSEKSDRRKSLTFYNLHEH